MVAAERGTHMVDAAAPRGTYDILPDQASKWQRIEGSIRDLCRVFGYREIRTPVFEYTDLFTRGIGEATDIVEKEMYTFEDKGGRSLTLRPEGTAPVVRAYLENKLYGEAQPVKVYYIGPMFRYERPQAGRYRQFFQFGAEAIGSQDPFLDVEMIVMPVRLYESLGLSRFIIKLNSLGCPRCRPRYREVLSGFLAPRLDELCSSCRSRYERNPLRILDCKRERCREQLDGVPAIFDYLCDECGEHFRAVTEYLDDMGFDYELDQTLVRGFDYYTKTVFEIITPELGAQDAISGGGRYDGLVEECGGKPTPGVGVAVGLDRLVLALETHGISVPSADDVDVFVAGIGSGVRSYVTRLVTELRDRATVTEIDYTGKSLRAQMRVADKLKARRVVIIGEDELTKGVASVRDMYSGEQREVPLDDIVDFLAQV